MIYKVKYFDIEKAKFEIIVITDKETLIQTISNILDDKHKSLKSVTKI